MDGRRIYKLHVFKLGPLTDRWSWVLRAPTGRLMAKAGRDHATRRLAWLAAARVQDLLQCPCILTVLTPDTKQGTVGRKAANAKAGRTGRTTRKAAQKRAAQSVVSEAAHMTGDDRRWQVAGKLARQRLAGA